ncbi:hypothetical protein KQX54_001578 [Cotesia glomerata]|uniref:Uncharacterized protein n=1 Tax=Cotesia glomerata TaxID=32391 RepID=A0AAV7J1S9_COTGL|nr:hypothetical protein KQX54_001578 [Cotesia glomerata]
MFGSLTGFNFYIWIYRNIETSGHRTTRDRDIETWIHGDIEPSGGANQVVVSSSKFQQPTNSTQRVTRPLYTLDKLISLLYSIHLSQQRTRPSKASLVPSRQSNQRTNEPTNEPTNQPTNQRITERAARIETLWPLCTPSAPAPPAPPPPSLLPPLLHSDKNNHAPEIKTKTLREDYSKRKDPSSA